MEFLGHIQQAVCEVVRCNRVASVALLTYLVVEMLVLLFFLRVYYVSSRKG